MDYPANRLHFPRLLTKVVRPDAGNRRGSGDDGPSCRRSWPASPAMMSNRCGDDAQITDVLDQPDVAQTGKYLQTDL